MAEWCHLALLGNGSEAIAVMTTPSITSVTNDGNGTSATLVVDGGAADTITVLGREAGSANEWASKGSRVGPGSVVASTLSNNTAWDFILTVTGELPSAVARAYITDGDYLFSDQRQGLFDWLSAVTGITTIWKRPNAPRPARPFVTLEMMAPEGVNMDYHSSPDDAGDETITGNHEFTVNAEIFGLASPGGDNPAHTLAKQIGSSLQKRSVLDSLKSAGLAPFDTPNVTDLSQIDNVDFQSRALVESRFRIGLQDTDQVGVIETAETPQGTYTI